MIEIDQPTALMIVGAIITPLLTTIGILWAAWQNSLKKKDDSDDAWVSKYDTMRDKYQDKVDQANKTASDAISSVTLALNGFSQALANSKDDKQKLTDEFSRLKDGLLREVQAIADQVKKL